MIHWSGRDWLPSAGDESALIRRILSHQAPLLTSDPASRSYLEGRTTAEKLQLKVHAAHGGRAALSPDGEHLVIGTMHMLTRWSTASGALEIRGPALAPRELAFSPDGTRLAVALMYGGARILEASTLAEVATIPGTVNTLAWSPDGSRLALGCGDGLLRSWDVTEGKLRAGMLIPDDHVVEVCFSPDGRWLAFAGTKHGAYLRNLDGSRTRPLGGAAIVHSLAFSRDSRTLLVGAAGKIQTWDIDHILQPEGMP